MSFSVWLQWFERGESQHVDASAVREAFGSLIAGHDGSRWPLGDRGGGASLGDLYMSEDDAGCVSGISIHRPCASPELWAAIYRLLQLKFAVCHWPGGRPVVARDDVVSHLPPDMLQSLGVPHLVNSGHDIERCIAET